MPEHPPRWLAWATALAGAALLAAWFAGADWQVLLLRRWALPAALAGAEILAAIGVSALLHALLRRALPGPAPRLSTHLIVGLPLYGTLVYAAASWSTAKAPMAVVLAVPALAGAVAVALRGVRWPSFAPAGLLGFASCALLGVVFTCAIVWATLPPATIDEVAYHLAVPKIWVLEGRVVELPLIATSYFPFGVESAHLPALALLADVGALTAHLVHLALAAAVLVLVVRWVSARASMGAALLAAAAIATPPALMTSAGLAWNEWPLLGIALVLFFSLEQWGETDGPPPACSVALVLAAGLSTKYTFVPFATAALLGAAFLLRGRMRTLAVATGCGGVLGSAFYLRNLLWTGDPVAPFLQPLAPAAGHFNSARGFIDLLRRYVYDQNLIDESIGATLFIAVLLLLVALPKSGRFVRVMTVAIGAAALLVLGGAPSARLVVPFLAPLALMGIVALDRLPLRRLFQSLLLVAASVQAAQGIFFLDTFAPISLLQKGPGGGPQLSGKAFLAQRPENFYPAIDWIDARLPPNSRLLVIGLHRLYWFSRPVRGGGNFDGPRLAAYLTADDPAQLRARFRGDGITHVAIFKTLLQVGDGPAGEGYRAESRTVLTQRQLAVLHAALDFGAKPIGEDKVAELYRLE